MTRKEIDNFLHGVRGSATDQEIGRSTHPEAGPPSKVDPLVDVYGAPFLQLSQSAPEFR
jgi:hypothetical protein